MIRRRRFSSHAGQGGFSLVELLIAVALGLIVVAGLINLLISNRKAYQVQQGNNYLQQNLRFASDRINWSLRMADFWGGVAAPNVAGAMTDGTGTSGCNAAWILAGRSGNLGGGVYGYDGGSSFPVGSCVDTQDYVKGSDVLVVRYVDTDPCAVDDTSAVLDTTGCLPASSHYLAASAGQIGNLFAKTAGVPTLTGASTRRYVYPYRVEMYYLQPCSNRGTGHCSSSSDGGSPQFTLMRMRLTDTGMQRDAIVEGIEQLQFEYGLENTATSNGIVQEYRSATDMGAGDWSHVVSVRVSMIARSRERDVAVPHGGTFALTANCNYVIANDGALTLNSDNTDCDGFTLSQTVKPQQFTRAPLTQVVQVRNRIRRPG
ncbi:MULTISPECIES: PilW family protein [Dyella]|uniref:Prepilin-type N-terminal cleavage/methylation domain-containing protein n=2 Tax=Dyella TaxID=231454 RepID=A0A4R0YYS2_9GAMM|nr:MULTISPECIES: PilW family protein [Dyella]TBR39756.1 prepilin-type N-terminal cleavage/methylation domain-containing protein [Dyella terrae]TCI13811.1 prepilin-type N-terminal cleavage/methylation domain-containing protein [Dyella soli]